MQALPSIAFGGFSGSAKGVTARQVAGRTILSVKSWPTGQTTNAQVARRTSMSKISKSWKLLSNDQMREWDRLAEHTSGQSAFGQKAEISGMNLYIRLNVNRAMVGEALLSTAPLSNVSVPNVIYNQVAITPELVVFGGITHEPSGVLIASVCLFFIEPLGEIASSAVSIVSELLVLCGAILGVKASYDVKFRKFEAELSQVIENEKKPTT